MCGRFDFHGEALDIEAAFGLTVSGKPTPACYNVAPTMQSSVLLAGEGGAAQLVALTFGLKRERGGLWVNLRSETSMRPAKGMTPCAVLANGFYEWRGEGKGKQPYYVRLPEQKVFGLAAWRRGGSFLILTCEPNELLAPVHPRMPVVLDKELLMPWLRGDLREATPYPAERMQAYPVARNVNDARFDAPSCITPLGD